MSDTEQGSFKRKPGRPKKLKPGPHLERMAVYLPAEIIAAIDAEVERQQLKSKSDAIRRAIVDWLRRAEKRRVRAAGDGATGKEDGDE